MFDRILQWQYIKWCQPDSCGTEYKLFYNEGDILAPPTSYLLGPIVTGMKPHCTAESGYLDPDVLT